MYNRHFSLYGVAATALLLSLQSCDHLDRPQNPNLDIKLVNQSVNPVLAQTMPGFESANVYSLISSDDKLPQSPNFVFGGSADGSGLLKNADGTFTMLVNHEDNFSVSRLTFDKTLKPVKGDYILNSDGGQWRLCSATMATPAEHGFGPLYLTCGESGQESRTHAVNPYGDASQNAISRELEGLGRWSAENAVPLNKNAYPGKTAILIGDDDSGANGGQLALYLTNTVGDLQNGSLYMLRRKDGNAREMDMKAGTKFDVEFVQIANHKTLTGAQINALVNDLKGIKFGRVEDIDYRKGSAANNRQVFFNVTGQANTGVNADYSRSKYGRTYRLTMDANDPLKGSLEVILDGDDRNGIAKTFQNVDNIYVGTNYLYVQEDPNSYGDETHDSYIYQYNLATGALKPAIILDHRRTATDAAKYNVGGLSKFGTWEYGAMIDVSETIGVPDSFIISLQPHTWIGDQYLGPDGGKLRSVKSTSDVSNQQASQLILVRGLPR
ncbi:hypothetical protein [Fibrella aquatilis]|uniref:Phosphatase n=1 Tax=Fibrella aquatilis TaxID=2817059 RepID=A0A939K0B3_9BACT|nr:hypothetical protein [Fibrella aquatilis]MBO0934014.1 hypothetical protein [Fibrella aquatilis]